MPDITGHTVSPFEKITAEDYPGVFGDFDHDKIANVDDPHPKTPGDHQTVEEVRLSNMVRKLIEIRRNYKAVQQAVMEDLQGLKPDATVKCRVKSPYSIINKLIRKRLPFDVLTAARAGEKYTKGITDMAGCMIVLESQKALHDVVEQISSGQLGKVFEHEDKYKNPTGGYMAHHFIVLRDGIPVEIQVKTERIKKITEFSHTPYKEGVLDQEKMRELSSLAQQADEGDRQAQQEFEEAISGDVEAKLTVRSNPSDKMQALRGDFRESVQKLAVIIGSGKFPEGKKEKAFQLFSHHAQLLGLDFDAIYGAALQEVDQKEKVAKSQIEETGQEYSGDGSSANAKFDIGVENLDLREYEPIQMTTAERAEANKKALSILQKEDRSITADDIEALRKYTGNGGLKDRDFANEEIEGKKRGALNEHYTSYPMIKMIWNKLGKMGVSRGNILEPGSGIGNFAGFLPSQDKMRMLMVEQSVVSSRISKLLYPEEKVINEKFQQTDLEPYNITGVIGNVPFGDLHVATRGDDLRELNPPIHDYFILKSLNALRPGGWMAIITSIGTMDKKNNKYRQAMVEQAGLVGAYRLPSTAFKANADALVTTDLLIFQKDRGGGNPYGENNKLFAEAPLAVETGRFGSDNEIWEAYYNPYFEENPGHVLGEHIQAYDAQWPSRMGVKGTIDEATVERVLGDGLAFKHELPEKQTFYDVPDSGVRLDIGREYHAGNIVFYEGKFFEKQRVFYKEISISEDRRPRVKSACQLLDIYDDFVTALARDSQQTEPLREELKSKLDSHIEQFGLPDEDEQLREVFQYDNRLYKLTTFVKRDPVDEELVYADILDADQMFSDNYTPKLDDAADLSEVAMFGHSIGERLDKDYYLSTWKGGTASGGQLEEAFQEHDDFFFNPENEGWEFKYEYLAGDVREKLEMAENYGLDKNVAALKEVLPAWIDVFKIKSDPRHIFTYLPHKVLQTFIEDKLQYPTVEIGLFKDKADVGNRFYMRLRRRGKYVKSGNETQADYNLGWGTIPFSKILNRYIQEKRFPFVAYDLDGNVLDITKKKLKKRAKQSDRWAEILENSTQKQADFTERMLRDVPQLFNSWLRTEAAGDIRDRVEEVYNKTFNSHVNPEFDGSTLRFRGMSGSFYGDADFRVFKHNRAVAEKMVWNGRGANCHDVGAGKTMASIITSQILLQQGACQKPMFVVPSKVQEKWVEEYSMLFPDAKILNMKMDRESEHKELTMAQLYDWDAIFIASHSFKRLSLSPDEKAERLQDRIQYFDNLLDNMDENIESESGIKNQAKKRIVKKVEKQKEQFETKLADVSDADRLDTDIFFDELGVDCLFFDESHFYKNALSSPKAQKLGIAATKTSQRAEDALQKTRWLFNEIGYRNVFALTATPVVNSPIEVWHLLNLCAPDHLEKYDIANLDNFINLYVRTEEKLVKKTTGKYTQEMVVAGYINLPEMRDIIDEIMDIKSYDQLVRFYEENPDFYVTEDGTKKRLKPQFKRPDINQERSIVEPSDVHELLFDDIVLRANEVLDCLKQKQCETRDNFLVITGDGSKIATDLRVYDDDFEGIDMKYLKLGDLVENAKQTYSIRSNPAPGNPESIYGDFFSRHRNSARQNPNPFAGWSDHRLIEELDSYGYFDDIVEIIREGKALDGDPPSTNWLIDKIEKKRATHSDGSDADEELFDKAVMIVESIYDYRQNPEPQTYRNQIIFCDWISLAGGAPGSFHQLIKDALAEAGIPEEQIAIVNGHMIGNHVVSSGDDKEVLKKKVQDDFNQGKYRILIGNQSIAEGMDLQKWTKSIHHMDVPYTPSEIQQRNGRGVRQGNQWDEVNVRFYLMQDSFDQYRLELVNKKQSWIDELFFGSSRTSEIENQSGTLNYEQMVAATNSDPRVKQFFNAKANADELKGKISTLDEELQRLRSSLATSEDDLERKRERLSSTIDRERQLMKSTLPSSAEEVLEKGLIEIQFSAFGGRIARIPINISNESRMIMGSRIHLELDVPQNNANGRILFDLIPPDKKGQRGFYNKQKWSSIKQMAPNELNQAFGWNNDNPVSSGYSIRGNKDNILVNQNDFYAAYGVDIEALREDGQSYDEIKQAIGMYDFSNWKPLLKENIARLFLILERAWVRGAEHRIEALKEHLEQAKKTLQTLEGNISRTKDQLDDARDRREQALETQSELKSVVNEIVEVEYQERGELYEELNRIAPNFGIREVVNIRDINRDVSFSGEQVEPGGTVEAKDAKEVSEENDYDSDYHVRDNPEKQDYVMALTETDSYEEALEYLKDMGFRVTDEIKERLYLEGEGTQVPTIRINPNARFIYLGVCKEISIDQGGQGKVVLKGPLAMLTNKAMDTLYIVPFWKLKDVDFQVNDKKAEQVFAEWHQYAADEQNYKIQWPAEAEPKPVGTAVEIYYYSDKIMRSGDQKDEKHLYHHKFDAGKRPCVTKGEVLIVKNIKINERGLLN